MPRRSGKSQAQKIHAAKRARYRFGVNIGENRLRAIIASIQAGKARFVDRQSIRITRWRVDVDGNEMIAVYDRKRKQIVTFLTPEMVA